jgi:hypothetical protein
MQPWERLLFEWSAEKAWFLGILYGDGNVYSYEANGDYRVSACGSWSTTTRWLTLLDPTRTPQEFKRSPGTFQAYVNSKELVAWFQQNMGICGPKADSLVWPEDLPLVFERDFVRGLWDSDGSLFIENRRHRRARGNDSPHSKFDSKCRSFVEELRAHLEALIPGLPRVVVGTERKKAKKSGNTSTWHVIKYGGKSAMLVADYLYADPPTHLVNEDRLVSYREVSGLRDQLTDEDCPCGKPVTREGRCQACWWEVHGRKTGSGSTCSESGCGKPVLAKGLCSAHYSRQVRSQTGWKRKPSGVCSCGEPAFRKGKCDACYASDRRAA